MNRAPSSTRHRQARGSRQHDAGQLRRHRRGRRWLAGADLIGRPDGYLRGRRARSQLGLRPELPPLDGRTTSRRTRAACSDIADGRRAVAERQCCSGRPGRVQPGLPSSVGQRRLHRCRRELRELAADTSFRSTSQSCRREDLTTDQARTPGIYTAAAGDTTAWQPVVRPVRRCRRPRSGRAGDR
jgi:hypothetical protein